MTTLSNTLFPVIAAVAVGCSETNGVEEFSPSNSVVTPVESLEWSGELNGVRTTPGYGDRDKGEYGAFVTFPANFVSPTHSHTHSYHGVVMSGVVINPLGGASAAKAPRLRSGSYWYVAPLEKHVTACVSDVPCTYYTHSAGHFDFIDVDH